MKEIKELDQKGIDFLVQEEGLEIVAYPDIRGVWTIGVGNTYYPDGTKVKKGDRINREEAISMFKTILKHYELTVYSNTRDDINQNQFNSLVSFSWNVGIQGFKDSTLLKKVNKDPNDPAIAAAFQLWKNAGNKKGVLLNRRIRESQLYFSKTYTLKETTADVNLRESNSSLSKIIRVVPKGTHVAVFDEKNFWSLINDGWIYSKYLK